MLAAEHAPEFQAFDLGAQLSDISRNTVRCRLVSLRFSEIKELAGVRQPTIEPFQQAHERFELGTLTAQRLGAWRIFPDIWILKGSLDFLQAFTLAIEVKDTPLARHNARQGHGSAGGWD